MSRETSMARIAHGAKRPCMGQNVHGANCREAKVYTPPKLGLMILLHIGINCRLNLILLAVVASVELFVAVNSQMFRPTRFPESSVEPYQLLYVN